MTDVPGRPQDVVERALSLSQADDCIVIADETSTANLRWAGNTLTTNGVARSRRLTVIAIDRRGDGAATGVVSRAGVRDDEIESVVQAQPVMRSVYDLAFAVDDVRSVMERALGVEGEELVLHRH